MSNLCNIYRSFLNEYFAAILNVLPNSRNRMHCRFVGLNVRKVYDSKIFQLNVTDKYLACPRFLVDLMSGTNAGLSMTLDFIMITFCLTDLLRHESNFLSSNC